MKKVLFILTSILGIYSLKAQIDPTVPPGWPNSQMNKSQGVISQKNASTLSANTNVSTIVINNSYQGWYGSSPISHDAGNTNYIVGYFGNNFRNYFTFNLANLNLTGKQVVGAKLYILDGGCSSGSSTVNYSLYDVTTNTNVLIATQSGSTAQNIWNDLGSGTDYGTFTQTTVLAGTRIFSLNQNALDDITTHAGDWFSIGGALTSVSSDHYLFGCSGGFYQQLVIELADASEPPTLSCPANITVNSDPNECGAIVNYPAATATGTPAPTINYSNTSGTFFPLGVTTVTVTASNGASPDATCTFTITVNDLQAPTVTQPDDIIVSNETGQCSAAVNFSANASDNCSIISLKYYLYYNTANQEEISFPKTFAVGSYVVTVVAKDATDNTTTKTFTITVIDNQPPSITCPAPVTINASQGLCTGTTTLTPPTVIDNCNSFGNALSFGGGYVNIPNTPILNPFNEWTLETWVKRTNTGVQESLIEKYIEPGNTYGYLLRILDNNKAMAGFVFGSFAGYFITGTTTILPNTWYHLAASFNRTTGVMKLYVNGVLDAQVTSMAGLPTIPNTASLKLGARGDDAATRLTNGGIMDEIRIWSVERTQAQIQLSMNSELIAQSGLVALYHLNQGIAGGNNTGITTATDASGNGNNGSLISFALIGATSNWVNGQGFGATVTNNAPATYPKGNTNVTWTATDGSGNTATCIQVVTVVDNQAPVITCPVTGNTNRNTNAGVCSYKALLTEFDATATDNCTVSSLTYSLTGVTTATGTTLAGVEFNKGITTVTWAAIDGAATTVTCSFTVTVADNEPPVILCPAPVTINASPGLCTGTTTLIPPTVTDNCNSFGNALNFNGGYVNVPHSSLITPLNAWTIETWVRRTTTNTQESLIEKYSNAYGVYGYLLRIQGDYAVTSFLISSNFGYTITGTTPLLPNVWYHLAATFNRTSGEIKLYVNGVLDGQLTGLSGLPTDPGTQSLKIGARGDDADTRLSNGGLMDEVRIWNVERTQAEILSSMNYELGAQPGLVALYHLNQGIAGGNNTGLTNVIDASGNGHNGSLIDFALTGPTSNWVGGKDFGLNLHNNAPDNFPTGNTIVTWTATDASGNSAACTQAVTVVDNQQPVITSPVTGNTNCNTNPGLCTYKAVLNEFNATATDNCGVTSLSYQLTGATTGTGTTLTDVVFNKGVTTVKWTASDGVTGTVTSSFTVTVADNQQPIITCPVTGNTNRNTDAGVCTYKAVLTEFNATATDNCAVTSFTYTLTGVTTGTGTTLAGVVLNKGVTTVTWTASDGVNTNVTCSFTVTVIDNQQPIITCPVTGNANRNTDAGVCTYKAVLTEFNATATDNCAVTSLVYVLTGVTTGTGTTLAGVVFNKGVTTVTWTASDGVTANVTCSFTVRVIDNEKPVITTCASNKTSASDAGFCTKTFTSAEIGSPTATDNCSYTLSWSRSDAALNLADPFPFGMNTITWTATDGAGLTATCNQTINIDKITTTTMVTVTPSTKQYSDKVTFTATVTPCGCGSLPAIGGLVTFKVGTQTMGTAAIVCGINGIGTATLSNVALLEPIPFGTAPTDQMVPDIKTVIATYSGAGAYLASNSTATNNLTITCEDARAYYTGACYASTSSPTNSNATVTLSATIKDITAISGDPDSDAGDIRNAKVRFVNRDLLVTDPNYYISGWLNVGLVNAADTKTGTVTYNWNTTISGDAQSYTIGIIVNNYYCRNMSDDDAVVTVAKPLGDLFITGGGYLVLTNSAGIKAGTAGTKNNFGFNVKYNRSQTNLQGNMNIIIRRLETDGIHVYQVKGNVMTSLVVNTGCPKTATFNGKANIQDITNPLLPPVPVDGNATLQVKMTDMGEPGSSDKIAITVWNKDGGLWFASNWNGTTTIEQVLGGGNLKVHGGAACITGSLTNQTVANRNMEVNAEPTHFNVKAYPNPSEYQFTLIINSNLNEAIVIQVYDAAGRKIQTLNVRANETISFGEKLKAGVYFAQIRQGNKQETVKLIKQ